MAKIIYGVSGQGFGHSTRSQEVLRHLTQAGHQVLVFTYGQAIFFLADEFEVFEVPGLGLSYKNNKLVYWRTIFVGLRQLINQSRHAHQIWKKFRQFNPDLVITDFEPLSAYLAKFNRRPLISLDNQHQLTNTVIDVPKKYQKDFLMDRLIIRSLVWGANKYLITSFFTTPIKKKNTFLFSPIVRQEVRALQASIGEYILVYQNSNFKYLVPVLKTLNYQFVVFGMNLDKPEGNIIFKNYDSRDWLNYLAGCRAIIGTAGLSLISEALYLGKPYLAVPIKKQVEQVINAVYLRKMGFGDYTYKLTREIFADFIDQEAIFRENLSILKQADNQEILAKLDEVITELVVD